MEFYEIDDIVLLVEGGLCSDPRKLDRMKPEFSATFPWLGEELKTMKASRFAN